MNAGDLFRADTLMPMTFSYNKPKHFYDRKVYLLVNATSFSASTLFSAYFRKFCIGPIVGTQSGGYSRITRGARIPVNNPLTRYVPMKIPHIVANPLGEDGYYYLSPDIPLENDFNHWLIGSDNSLYQLLTLIKENCIKGFDHPTQTLPLP